jgi:hypothetical protein
MVGLDESVRYDIKKEKKRQRKLCYIPHAPVFAAVISAESPAKSSV